MLPRSHNRAYQDFITLLTNFGNFADDSLNRKEQFAIKQEFESLQQWFEQHIDNLDHQGIEAAYIPRWQSIQREINREFKLLTTDILFFTSARQNSTKAKRLKNINAHLNKLLNYCQGMLKEINNQE